MLLSVFRMRRWTRKWLKIIFALFSLMFVTYTTMYTNFYDSYSDAEENIEFPLRKIEPFTGTVPHCTHAERLSSVQQYCREQQVAQKFMASKVPFWQDKHGNTDTFTDYLDDIPDRMIKKLAHELWLDPVNKVIVCMHAKVGCSTWKTILGNNTRDEPLPSNYAKSNKGQRIHTEVFVMGMKCADDGGDAQVIRERLRTWYKFAIVRHPFDRLVSSFNDKFVGKGVESIRALPRWKLKLGAKLDETINFEKFITHVLAGARNDHWDGPYEEKCHLCLFHYDYVVKLETQEPDAEYIIRNKLRGRGAGTKINTIQKPSSALVQDGRDLSAYFGELSQEQYLGIVRRHESDFQMFGYTMDKDTFYAKCSGQGENRICC